MFTRAPILVVILLTTALGVAQADYPLMVTIQEIGTGLHANGNGAIEPGEIVRLHFALTNTGSAVETGQLALRAVSAQVDASTLIFPPAASGAIVRAATVLQTGKAWPPLLRGTLSLNGIIQEHVWQVGDGLPGDATAHPAAQVRLHVMPANAHVTVKGIPVNVVQGDAVLSGLAAGAYAVTVTAEGHTAKTLFLILQNGDVVERTVVLEPVVVASEKPEARSYPEQYSDPAETQVFTAPTAHTLRKGDSRISATEFVLYQYNYGVTDNLQLGINTLVIVQTSVDAKYRFVDTEHWDAAVLLGFAFSPIDRTERAGYARLAATGTYGNLEMTAVATGLAVRLETEESRPLPDGQGGTTETIVRKRQTNTALAGTAAVTYRTGKRTKLMLEYDYLLPFTEGRRERGGDALFWGARFVWPQFAVGVGYLTPLDLPTLRDGIFGVPYLDFSYTF